MYDNGVVSFLQPGTPGSLSPWQWSSQPLTQTPYKYFIAALWGDIAPTGSTTYTTNTDGSTYLKYNWNNISEYYSGGSRLNSFSTKINVDGSVQTFYTALNLQTSNISVGTVGDPSKGEINQVYYAPFGTKITNGTIADWSYLGGGPATDPCAENPLSSTSCPGYATALLKSLPQTPTTNETTTTVTEPVASAATPLAAPITTAPTNPTSTATVTEPAATTTTATATSATPVVSAAPTALNPQPKIGEVQTAGSTKPQVSMSTIMSAVNAEQSRVQQAEKMVAEQVKEISATVTANAEATASNASNQSIAIANTSAAKSSAPTAAVVNSVVGVPGASLNIGTAMTVQQAYGIPEVQHVSGEAMQVAVMKPPTPIAVDNTSSSIFEKKSTEDVALKDLLVGTPTIAQMQEVKSGPVVNAKTKDNDAAGSITIAAIATVPLGYEAYSVMGLKDTPFYPPTQVYKNQKTVDNVRVLRAMNAKSDKKHEEMVEQQYNLGKQK